MKIDPNNPEQRRAYHTVLCGKCKTPSPYILDQAFLYDEDHEGWDGEQVIIGPYCYDIRLYQCGHCNQKWLSEDGYWEDEE